MPDFPDKPCKFLSTEPYINDVYKFPETRYLCRCTKRLAQQKGYADRFVGVNDCQNCVYNSNRIEEHDTDDNQQLPVYN